MIRYTVDADGLTADRLQGFFVGWREPRTPEEHLGILSGSDFIVLAIEEATERVVGYVTAISDGVQAAFIPLLEVLPSHQGQGVGSELMRRMLVALEGIPCIDLMCDPAVQPFYERLGMTRSVGMVRRAYSKENR